MSSLERTARHFRRHRRKPISVTRLVRIGGLCRWRTAVSECRTKLGMNVIWNGDTKRSAYKYVGRLA